jgi:hypothetical protein
MNRAIWIGVVGVIAIAAGGWWYLGQSNRSGLSETIQLPIEQRNIDIRTQETSPQPKTATTNSASYASINKSSLVTNQRAAKITGSCANIAGALSVYVLSGTVSLPQSSLPNTGVLYQDTTDHGGTIEATCNSSNGSFSTQEIQTVQGAYTVGVYGFTNTYTSTGYQGPLKIQLLASGRLTSNYQTSDLMPTVIGQCVTTTVKEIDSTIPPPGSPESGQADVYYPTRSALTYTALTPEGGNGYQVSDAPIIGIDTSRAGDQVRVCLKSIPENCPVGDTRGKVYTAINVRTNATWEAYDSRHMCGGA